VSKPVKLPSKDIRLLTESQHKARLKRMIVHYVRIALSIILICAVLHVGYQFMRMAQLNIANNHAIREIARLEPINAMDIDVTFRERFVRRRANFWAQLRNEEPHYFTFIERLERVIPRDVEITSIAIDLEGNVIIRGEADNEVRAADVSFALRESGLMDDAEMTSFSMDSYGESTFTVEGTQNGFRTQVPSAPVVAMPDTIENGNEMHI